MLTLTCKLDPTVADVSADLQVKTTVPAGADATAGIGYINVEATDTVGLVAGANYEYDVQWVQKSTSPENVHTLTKGKIKIIEQVTIDTT